MEIYRCLTNIPKIKNRVLTIGSFDGVHRGHLSILKALISEAKTNNIKSMVITFEPHPQLVIQNPLRSNLKILNDINEKIALLKNIGIDELLIIPFTKEFSQLSPEQYIKDILINKVGFSKILVGYDHLFGENRSGNYALLNKLSQEFGFEVMQLQAFTSDDTIISSSIIRQLISQCKIEEANMLLGYQYRVSGKVIQGNKLGRQIGYPTINIEPNVSNKMLPGRGVYLSKVILENAEYWGMANLGLRPTLTNDQKTTLEINLFDFNQDAYNKDVTAIFYKHIRNEQKFSNVKDLIEQLGKDKENCKNLLNIFL